MAAGHVVPISVRHFGRLPPRSRMRFGVYTCVLLKWLPLRTGKRSSSATKQFQRKSHYFLTSVGRWVCKPISRATGHEHHTYQPADKPLLEKCVKSV